MASRILFLVLASCIFTIAATENLDYTYGWTRVRFLGKSPNFQIYPNTSLSSFLQLKLSKFEERDPSGKKIQGHSVESLASADPVWETANATMADGTNLTYVRMTLDPATRNGFSISCPTSNNRRMLLANSPSTSNITVRVTVAFGFDQNTSVVFGRSENVSVNKGGIKFNVEYSNWPFCDNSNVLGMEIDLMIKGNGTTKASILAASDGTQVLSVPLEDDTTSNIYFATHAYEVQKGNRSMSVGVSLSTNGSTSTVTLKLPNPQPNTSVYYDPTVVMTVGGGASGIIYPKWWSVLLVMLLINSLCSAL